MILPSADKSHKLIFFFFVVAVFLGGIASFLTGKYSDIFTDDAYYYMIVAQNFFESGRFTFDGISETNGFHPLLFWIEVALAALLGKGALPIDFYNVLLWFHVGVVFLLIYGIFILFKTSTANKNDQHFFYVLISGIVFCFVSRNAWVFFNGMEAILSFPLTVFVIVFTYKKKYLSAGATAVFLVASRLDTIVYLITPIFLIFSLYEGHKEKSWRILLKTGLKLFLPATFFLLGYMVFNKLYFGSAMPIHGVLKSSFPVPHIQWHNLFEPLGVNLFHYVPFQTSVMVLIGGGLLVFPRKIMGRSHVLAIAIAIVTLTQLTSFVFFQKWTKPVPIWYYGLPLFTGMLSLCFGLSNYFSLKIVRRTVLGIVFLAILINGKWLGGRLLYALESPPFDLGTKTEVVKFIKSKPQDDLWAYTDCGKLSFWSNRKFMNLDGLINNFDYQSNLRNKSLLRYLKEKNVKYLLTGVWSNKQTLYREYEPMYKYREASNVFSGDYTRFNFYVYSYLYATYSDTIPLPKSAEVWRSPAYPDGLCKGKLIAYDLSSHTSKLTIPTPLHSNDEK